MGLCDKFLFSVFVMCFFPGEKLTVKYFRSLQFCCSRYNLKGTQLTLERQTSVVLIIQLLTPLLYLLQVLRMAIQTTGGSGGNLVPTTDFHIFQV